MKKYFVLLSAMLVMAACAKGPQGNGTTVPEEESSAPVPVQLQANLPAVTPVTKSSIGALDKWHADQKLYVYGIPRVGLNANANATAALDWDNILIDNVQATFPGAFDPTTTTPQLVSVIRTGEEPYYYKEDRRYEFFGYYVDEGENATPPTPTVGDNAISLAVKIDGSQDLMLAKTDKEADNVTDLNPNRLYSAYSARHGVTPNLVFKHLLSRFNVYVKSGDPSVTDKITITSFTVRSKTDGTIFIAYKDHPAQEDEQHPNLTVSSEESNYAYLPIWNGANGAATKRLLYSLTGEEQKYDLKFKVDEEVNNNNWPARNNPLGTIMVMPYETEYEIQVGLKQDGYTASLTGETITTYTVKFADLLSPDRDPKPQDPNNPRPGITETELDTQALPGHQYDLNVVVYGLQAIQVTVSLQEWEDSGNFVVDQDEDQAIAIKIAELDEDGQPNYGEGTKDHPLELNAGADYPFTATTDPESQISYESSNPAVATVESGLIHAVGAGDAKIIITADPTPKQPEGGYRVIRVRVTGPVVFTPVGVDFAGVEMTGNETKDISTLFTLSAGYTGTLAYEITGGNAGDFFTLSGSNLTAGAADASPHTVTVTVTAPADNENNFSGTTQAIVFNVAAI